VADKHIGNRQANYVVVSMAPDVCKVGDALVPFDSFQDLSHEKNYVTHVRARGQPILTVGSVIAGTQSNAGKGISSGTSLDNGDCQILTGVPHIKCKGMPIARHGSLVAMNNGNTMGSLYTQLNPPNGRIPVKDTPSWWEKIAEQEAERQKLEMENNQQMAELLEGMGRSFINHQYDFGRELGKGGMLNGSIEFEQQIAVLKAMGADTRIMEEANALNQITVDEIDDSPPLLEMENETQEMGAKLETRLELLLLVKALMSGGVKSIKWLSGRGGSGGVKIVAVLGVAESTNYRMIFFAKYPWLEGKVFVHHAVEQQVMKRYPGVLSEAELHSIENLRGIPKELNSELHLSKIRREWNVFYRTHPKPTKQELLDKATEIDKRFGSQFNPPVQE